MEGSWRRASPTNSFSETWRELHLAIYMVRANALADSLMLSLTVEENPKCQTGLLVSTGFCRQTRSRL